MTFNRLSENVCVTSQAVDQLNMLPPMETERKCVGVEPDNKQPK